MELQKPRLPVPVSIEHHPESRIWPAAPTTSLLPATTAADITLPDLKTVLSPEYEQLSPGLPNINHHHTSDSPHSARSLPPIDVGHAPYHASHRSMDSAVLSPVESNSAMSLEDRAARSTSVPSVDDPRERIAAEVLSGLGNPDFARAQNVHMSSHAGASIGARASDSNLPSEPLLELIQQAHPWVGGTIKGSLTAYSTTKHYSPRFVQYGANLVERNITTPVVSAVSSVGELTGAEHGLRRYLGSRRPPEAERESSMGMPIKSETGLFSDGSEMHIDTIEPPAEALPAYRASRPPSYREMPSPVFTEAALANTKLGDRRASGNRSWSSQFLITTSGLSVALSRTSRESLKTCLHMLSESFGHVQNLTGALSLVLQQYEATRQHVRHAQDSALEKGEVDRPPTPNQDAAAQELADAIQHHCDAIWGTLRWVVESVSSTVGGALPDNARQFVRQQFMSLPQRWQVASNRESAESETSRAAQRMIGFATEGLDMMTQVSSVLKVTLDSAERWLERVGRRDINDEQHMQLDASQSPWEGQTLPTVPEKS